MRYSEEDLSKTVMDLNQVAQLYEVLRPDLLLPKVTDDYWYFEDISGPTNEEPPEIVTDTTEPITIDRYLGLYLPERQEIKIFDENIQIVSRKLSCEPEVLQYVVRYHEQAHAIIHLGVNQQDRTRALADQDFRRQRLGELTSRFVKIDEDLGEHLAQLLTYHALLEVGNKLHELSLKSRFDSLLDVFEQLMNYQPAHYRVRPYLEVPRQRIVNTISLIKKGYLVGKLDPWLTIILSE